VPEALREGANKGECVVHPERHIFAAIVCWHAKQVNVSMSGRHVSTVENEFWPDGVSSGIFYIKSVCAFKPVLESLKVEADSDVVLAADEEVTPETARTMEAGRAIIDGEEPSEPATSEHGQVMAF